MNTRLWMTLSASAALMCGLVLASSAAPLTLSNVTAANAAARLSDKYGVNIVLKGNFTADYGKPMRVSFTIDDADAPGAQLDAVNTLANSLGADFTKTYVISKMTGDDTLSPPKIDSTALITFPNTTLSTADAVALVAGVDNATAQIASDVDDTVTLSAPSLTALHAAEEISKQTHTRWKTFFALTPRSNGRTAGGKVIDRTNGGQPITELPYVYYTHPKSAAEQQREAQQDQAQANQQAAAEQQADIAAAAANGYGQNGNTPNGYYNPTNNAPYGYNPYGYGNPYGGFNPMGYGNPYGNGYGGNGYGGNGYANAGNGLSVGNGYGYGNGPIVFGGVGY